MNRFTRLLVVPVFGLTLAWAQAPAQQPAPAAPSSPAAAPATAGGASQPASVSGCMTQWFGQYNVADAASSKSWQVKGNVADLASHENHVVKIQGLPDPKAPSPLLYVESVQDTGQTCGNAQASNTAQPGAAPASGATAATAGAATNGTAVGRAQSQPQQQPGGGLAQPSSTAPSPSAATPQATTPQSATQQQGGVSGTAAGSTPPQAEAKGTPEAGTPQQASIASNTALPASSDRVFNGCLGGVVNAYQFKSADGKVYHLQGNTGNLAGMVNHNVEITGEDFNGKAIQVNGARDLGGTCKAK